jgi:hypothetical protein
VSGAVAAMVVPDRSVSKTMARGMRVEGMAGS